MPQNDKERTSLIQRRIKAILFDLGETILNFGKLNTSGLFTQAARTTYDFLKQLSQPVGSFHLYLWRNIFGLRVHYLISSITGNDFDSLTLLKKNGQKKGFKLSDQQWEQLNWLWYQPLSTKASIEPDIVQTLTKLTNDGVKLGIVSNTFVHSSSLDRHLAQCELLEFFPLRIYSYQLHCRKPHKGIFLAAAQQIGEDPEDILFVGDRINKDIKGAIKAGMTPVLKTAYTNTGKKVPPGVEIINTIAELPNLVGKISPTSLFHNPKETEPARKQIT
jgi:HAD superfamily hydrolase (TIGR01549 family)